MKKKKSKKGEKIYLKVMLKAIYDTQKNVKNTSFFYL